MKHHAFEAAMGLLIAAVLLPTGQAQAASADPTGIWRKAQQGERPGKMQVFRCGRSKKLLCAKIVWLQNPLDSKGRPLHDVRNENRSMRDRPILGLPVFNGLTPTGPATWKGAIYNPEDGNTYSATLTLVSRNKIHLKGCKAWLLCGERTWLRTSLPKPEPEPEAEPQIEASVEPEAGAQPSATAAAEPQEAAPNVLSEAEMLTPVVQPGTRPGYRFLNASANAETPAGFSGEDVPSMFAMTKLIAPQPAPAPADAESEAPAASTAAAPAPPAPRPAVQAPKPKSQSLQAAAAPKPRPVPAAPAARSAPVPADAQADDIATAETETAETAVVDQPPLTRRQKRLLRRQQQQNQGSLLPWLR